MGILFQISFFQSRVLAGDLTGRFRYGINTLCMHLYQKCWEYLSFSASSQLWGKRFSTCQHVATRHDYISVGSQLYLYLVPFSRPLKQSYENKLVWRNTLCQQRAGLHTYKWLECFWRMWLRYCKTSLLKHVQNPRTRWINCLKFSYPTSDNWTHVVSNNIFNMFGGDILITTTKMGMSQHWYYY